jgi:uncharacterized membrane protein YozB (DUF420 family)
MGLLMTAIVLFGFLPQVLSKPQGAFSLPILYHIHGLIFVSWFVLFFVQGSFVRGGNLQRHRRFGQSSIALAIAMLVSGYFMIRAAYALPEFSIGENSHIASTMFPVTDLINFSIAYTLALYHRTNGVAHKRLMLLAGILILDPAVARSIETIGAPFPFIPILELGLFALLFGYDISRLRRPHWTSCLGLALFLAAMMAKLKLAQLPLWTDIAALLFA